MRRVFLALLGFSAAGILHAYAQSAPSSPPQVASSTAGQETPTVSEDYIIGPEDVLDISVWREPDFSIRAVVRPDGKIGIKLLNDVQASGLTTKELKHRIEEGLSQFVPDAVVSVIVTDVKSQMVHIIGSVARQGAFPLGGPLTVMELLARAGGLADFAKKENIVIVRWEAGQNRRVRFNYKTYVEGKNLQQNITLKNGDVIIVP